MCAGGWGEICAHGKRVDSWGKGGHIPSGRSRDASRDEFDLPNSGDEFYFILIYLFKNVFFRVSSTFISICFILLYF